MIESILPFMGLRTPVSSLTHLMGLLFSVYGTLRLWRLDQGDLRGRWALVCFGLSATLLYSASTIYHALDLPPPQLAVFQLIDHSAIYLLIAGTYTPTLVRLLRPSRRKTFLVATMWALAITGIACKWLVDHPPYWLVVTPYLALGWIGVLEILQISQVVGRRGLAWMFAGGVAYSVGAVLDLLGWPRMMPGVFGSHEVFHVATLVGTYCHYVFMMRFVVRPKGARLSEFTPHTQDGRVAALRPSPCDMVNLEPQREAT